MKQNATFPIRRLLLIMGLACIVVPPSFSHCVICEGGSAGFWCVGAEFGADRCRADANICFVFGPCPGIPIPNPPTPQPEPPMAMSMNFEYFFDVGSISGLPAVVSLSSAWDVETIRQAIADRTGDSPDDVILKGGMFAIGSIPGGARDATHAQNVGSLLRLDFQSDGSLRARTCSGPPRGTPGLKTDDVLPPEGAVVLVPIVVEGDSTVVVAYKVERTTTEAFNADPYAPQQAFRDDVSAHLTLPAYRMAAGEMTADCD